MPQVCVKLENDTAGRVSESQKCFQLGTQFRDTSSEHSTHKHDTRSTCIEHHHQDNMCITTTTDEELTNDDEDKMGKGGARRQQSNPCKIWKQNTSNDRERTGTANGRKLRKVRGPRWEDHDAKINQTVEESYHCPHRRQDDGRRIEEGSEEAGQGGNNKLLRK